MMEFIDILMRLSMLLLASVGALTICGFIILSRKPIKCNSFFIETSKIGKTTLFLCDERSDIAYIELNLYETSKLSQQLNDAYMGKLTTN